MSSEESKKHDKPIISLSNYVLNEQNAKFPNANGDLTLLLVSIQLACKFISSCVRKAGLANLTGLEGGTNVQGEQVKKLDVISNNTFIHSLKQCGRVGVMVSEENDDIILVSNAPHAKYSCVFDPLDGSSNIECGVSIGSIFGIYRMDNTNDHNVLKPGKDMVAAGYCMYGSSTMFVLTTGNGVNGNIILMKGFTLDTAIGEFVLTHPNIKIPSRGKIYSINEGNTQYWDTPTTEYISSLKNAKKPYSSRYVGSMVADVHRTFLYGGIFAYPPDSKSKDGKLRVLYEAFPMSYLAEQAGGKSSLGGKKQEGKSRRVLDLTPKGPHERTGIWLGSIEDVNDMEAFYDK